jgi:hypothetical protein
MRLADLEKRVLDLEKRTATSDELGLIIGAMARAHCRSLGQPYRVNVLDSELDKLAALTTLPDGTSSLVLIAWELLHDDSAPLLQGEN